MATLKLENARQVALWNSEITGQLSDGMWENTNPQDHWEPWCDCEAVVADNGEIGRDFWVRKDGYALHSLIKWLGDRMIFYGNLANLLSGEVPNCRLPSNKRDWEHTQEMATSPDYPGDYYIDEWIQLDDAGVTDEIIEQASEGDYDEKALRADLSAIKRAMKTQL